MLKPKLWMGLTTAGVLLTSTVLSAQALSVTNEGLIRDFLNQSNTKVDSIDSDEVVGSDYKDENGALSNEGWKKMIADSYKFCEQAVEQGTVLFKNKVKDGVPTLPLAENERKISLLGQGSKNLFMRSGAGGAAPNTNLVVKFDQAFKDNGFEINKTIFSKYSTLSNSQMTSPNTQVEHKFDGFYTQEMMDSLAQYNDAAIITFVRIGTENSDPGAGQLNIKEDEIKLLKMVKESGQFKKIIVLINSPMPMSMDWVDNEEYGVDACAWIGVPGYYGAGGAVHVLMGKDADGNLVNPSGHAPDTFAANASSSAAYQNFGDANCVVYKEGVYVGYKYYETRYYDSIVHPDWGADSTAGVYNSKAGWNYAEEMGYPFGFGLSYTDFKQTIKSVTYNAEKDQYDVTVEVENTGNVDGKASIQVYVNAPYSDYDKALGLGKSAISLMGYEKVDVKAGKKVTKTVSFDKYFLTTYDYSNNRTYVLEGGDYYFAVGNGAHEALNNVLSVTNPGASLYDHNGQPYTGDSKAVQLVQINEDFMTYRKSHYSDVNVENQFDDADYNYHALKNGKTGITYLDRQDWKGTWPTKETNNPASSSDRNMAQYYTQAMNSESASAGKGVWYDVKNLNEQGVEEKITFSEMSKVPLKGEITEGRFAGMDGADVWDKFIAQMNLDDLVISVTDNRGILDVGKVLKKGNSVAEGPEGLLSKYQYGDKRWATGFPTGPVYTATFDHDMQKKFGGFYGEDALFCGVACVNAPGANINRTPYGSRASEYMSEDGVLNYNVAANIVGEARRKGLIMNIKHCFLNNQETGRQGVSTFCNEQAIREIYLRPFEGALTKGNGLGIMTSYNRIGVRYAATHQPLMENVMRKEWDYKGLIIDDALPGGNTDSYSNGPAMLYCGTDLFCLDGNRGRDLKQYVNDYNDGTILRCLQRANKNIMYAISRSWMGGITVTEDELQQNSNPVWKKAVKGTAIGSEVLTVALFGMYVFAEIISKKPKIESAE